MDLTLQRLQFRSDGIFGQLLWNGNVPYCKTLEHAYAAVNDSWAPKLPPGVYRCARGVHRLTHSGPFTTFEVNGVPGHSGILFHAGNYNEDSDGCILLGEFVIKEEEYWFLANSRKTFDLFMSQQTGDTFTLTVI